MAATRIIPMHIQKGTTRAKSLSDRLKYSQNPEKTDGGELVTAHACTPETAEEEFLLTKQEYERITGRVYPGEIIAYQIRQSFKPGEITPEEANKIGYETAMRFTKGRHAFTVSTHIDRAHIHNHIIFNSTTLDCTRKFRNFWWSTLAVQRLSDTVCLEHGLSVIEPKPYGKRVKRTVYPRRHTKRMKIRADLDDIMRQNPQDMADVVRMFRERSYEVKEGKYLAVRGRGQKNFIRLRSLKTGYTEQDVLRQIEEQRSSGNRRNRWKPGDRPLGMLIDIQEKLNAGKGKGYERWAKNFNIKQMAQVLCFLQENGVSDYQELVRRAEQATTGFNELTCAIKDKERRLHEIADLKKHIFNYSRTRKIYEEYRKGGYKKTFAEAHREEIALHKATKEAFNATGQKKLPKIKELNEEYARVLVEKRALYAEYRSRRKQMQDYTVARKNVEMILEINPEREQTTTLHR